PSVIKRMSGLPSNIDSWIVENAALNALVKLVPPDAIR
ncbi:hypothetical protein LCGC14_2307250, partial [marine sediment metagenome]